MNKKKLFSRIALLIVFISITNFLAMKFYWYSSIWYFDMFMHFMGGFWLGLGFLALFFYKKPFRVSDFNFSFIFKIILGVLLIGIFWEIFEILVDKTISHNGFNTLDTFSDLFFDLAGGLFAIFYFLKRLC